MNLFDLVYTEQPQKGIVRTKQGGWAGTVDVGDIVNLNNTKCLVVGPPHYDTIMLRAEIENGYVIIEPNGDRSYYDMQDRLHRDDGPASIWQGTVRWYRHGKLHREDGPALIYTNGTEQWYHNGNPHREDGPAVTQSDGTRAWYHHGKRHREDGPAVVKANGTEEYWLHGKRVDKEDLS